MTGELPGGGEQIACLGPLQFGLFERQWFSVVDLQPRFGIEQVDMRRSTRHVQEDDPLGPGSKMGRQLGKRVGGATAGGLCLAVMRQEARERQHSKSTA